MVTRERTQGETIQLLVLPPAVSLARVFAVFKGPSGAPVTVEGTKRTTVIGSPWCIGPGGWMDFGPTPPFVNLWSIKQDSSAFAAGQWGAEIWTVDAHSNKTVLCRVSFSVSLSVAAGGSGDLRSTAAKAVEAIEGYLADPKNFSAAEYKINNRELTRYSISELRSLLRFWKQKLKDENRRASGMTGRIGKRIEVIF